MRIINRNFGIYITRKRTNRSGMRTDSRVGPWAVRCLFNVLRVLSCACFPSGSRHQKTSETMILGSLRRSFKFYVLKHLRSMGLRQWRPWPSWRLACRVCSRSSRVCARGEESSFCRCQCCFFSWPWWTSYIFSSWCGSRHRSERPSSFTYESLIFQCIYWCNGSACASYQPREYLSSIRKKNELRKLAPK